MSSVHDEIDEAKFNVMDVVGRMRDGGWWWGNFTLRVYATHVPPGK
jgi:hypothetical protein